MQPRAVPDRLLAVKEVSQRLAVCRATVYALCEDGKLPHVRISHAIRVPESSLERFIAEQTTAR